MITKFKNYLNNDASDHAYVELILNVLADWIIVDETEIFKKKDLIEIYKKFIKHPSLGVRLGCHSFMNSYL